MIYDDFVRIADSVIAEAAVIFGVDVAGIRGKCRRVEFTDPRHAVIYVLVKKYCAETRMNILYRPTNRVSLLMVGNYFDGRDHSTIIHSKRAAEDIMFTDNIYRRKVNRLNAKADEVFEQILKEYINVA